MTRALGMTAVAALALAVLCGAGGVVHARVADEGELAGTGQPLQSGGMVWITVDEDLVVLENEIDVPPQGGVPMQPALAGTVGFSVTSPLASWSVRAEFEPIGGPSSPLPLERVRIRSTATGGEFVEAAGGVIVAEGQGPAPAPDLWLEIKLGPEWSDEPGVYHGLLHLTPMVTPEDHYSEIEYPGALRVVTGGVGSLASPFGPRVTVPVVATVRALTVVATSETEFAIETEAGPGRYFVEPDLGVVVATNEEQWEVVLNGTAFISEDAEIPLERVEWTMLDESGAPGVWTTVGDDCCLMSSAGERGVFWEDFRLALDVIVTDVAGEYESEIHLVGSPR